MKKTQQGIALVETLLIILILAIIGFGGYYVWHTQKQTDKTNADTLKAGNSQTAVPNNSNSKANSSGAYFTIKEWGVQSPLVASLTPEYKVVKQDQWTWAYFSSDILNASDSNCTTDGGYGGVIVREAAGQKLMGVSGPSDQTIEQAIAQGVVKKYSHVGNYYYYYQHPQAACGTSDASVTAQKETEPVIEQIANTLQAIK